jgi:hypothetical protein
MSARWQSYDKGYAVKKKPDWADERIGAHPAVWGFSILCWTG